MALFLFPKISYCNPGFWIIRTNKHNNSEEGSGYFDRFQKCNQEIW